VSGEAPLNVAEHGWPAVRSAVFGRDGGCVAGQPRIFGRDAADDGCRSQWGQRIDWDDWDQLEWDHVTQENVRHDDEAHGVAVCPWHHRLSQAWRSDSRRHRAALRRWLAKHWPEVWNAD
jgi:hypothetical protein